MAEIFAFGWSEGTTPYTRLAFVGDALRQLQWNSKHLFAVLALLQPTAIFTSAPFFYLYRKKGAKTRQNGVRLEMNHGIFWFHCILE
ncbi:hypothetical protein KFK09_008429 [Dendrobium nobile]|uniref:Uncharacterized protein n=1 Tax=Dendrobium nobile TaxID=94219 RepID=A0A8T3BNQ7_DENNO|nr:hypothetical protein KFK09_008429 [Dendrobium nobile]